MHRVSCEWRARSRPPPPPPFPSSRRDNVVRVKKERKERDRRGGGVEQRKGEAWANKARGPCSYLSRRGSAETRKTDSTARQWPSFMNARAKVYASPRHRISTLPSSSLLVVAWRTWLLSIFPTEYPFPLSQMFLIFVRYLKEGGREKREEETLCTRIRRLWYLGEDCH